MARRLKFLLLTWLGVTPLWRWLNRYRVTILFMHGVMAEADGSGERPTRWQLDPEMLDSYLKVLGRYYEFVPVSEAVEIIAGNRSPRKYVAAVTIDDGYRNAATHAWPVLHSNGVPVSVYVTSGQMFSEQPFLWDRLDYALLRADASLRSVHIGEHEVDIDLSDRASIDRSSRKIIFRSRALFDVESQRIAALRDLVERLENGSIPEELGSWSGVMGAEEVLELSNAGATIGSHSRDHVRLAHCRDEEIEYQVTRSKSDLEQVLNGDCSEFCFPEGSVDTRAVESVRNAGYSCALSTENGLNEVGHDIYRLKRIHLPESASPDELLAIVGGLNRRFASLWTRLRPGSG